ncbi:RING finger protein 32 [Trypanosoma theileri]|uniref:RING finger protein 32 n=1 Tax=Trypanosoma theileri TaxID=67003 RepID=A0A1X0P5K1_9TRYP|nr:RING finger protein 32 [Trypanosoma theileri]ORC92224.1 RING finger protein 32 [Trypanosoma theileri]
MSADHSSLPSIGRKVNAGWGTHTTRRKDQIQIWSAVALQQHFARGALVNSTLPTLEEVPPPLPGGRLTLAQKMGLVPLPPPEPTEEEWKKIESTALRRNVVMPLGSNACSICQEPFYATMEQGQLLLSCSHVFHENCFRQFEKFARRSRGKHDATPMCCPICRRSNYHKRIFYAGKAMEQRAAIVKIQAFFRRVLARKAYVKLRLENDSDFCGEYARERLARLSEAYTEYAIRREKERVQILENIDLYMQRAQAACITKAEWKALRKRVEAETEGGVLDCPICLTAIDKNPNAEEAPKPKTGEEIVAVFRKEYEARMARKNANENKRKSCYQGLTERNSSVKPVKISISNPLGSSLLRQGSSAKKLSISGKINSSTTSSNSCSKRTVCGDHTDVPRHGTLLSCGHCFHDACLSVFEKYTEMMAVQREGDTVIPRCPLCRSAYVKCDY